MPATIASYLPYELGEYKPGLTPGYYVIRPGDGKLKFSTTVIPEGAYHQINPDPLAEMKDVHWVKIPVLALELAQSIIMDYSTALLAAQPPDAMPGLLAVPGEYDEKTMATKFPHQLKATREMQTQWFRNLVEIADDTWAKTKSPLGIADLQRHAAESLEIKREWLLGPPPEEIEKCPVCMNPVLPGALKCAMPGCGYVLRPVEYAKLMNSPHEKNGR
jgi:hypothetical protein